MTVRSRYNCARANCACAEANADRAAANCGLRKASLLELGLRHGDRAILFVPMSVPLYLALCGLQRIGAIGAGDTVLHAHIGGKLRLQFLDLRAVDELAMRQNGGHAGIHVGFQTLILGLKINKLHQLGFLLVTLITPLRRL